MKAGMICLTAIFFIGCKSDILFQGRKYYSGVTTLEFYSDNSYQYMEKMEGGYVNKYSRGTWKQDGKKLFLLTESSNTNDLPTNIRTGVSSEPGAQLVINILPKRNLNFSYLPSTIDLLKVELVIDKMVYPLNDETNIIRLQKSFDKGYIRAYPKPGVERTSEILSDTLRSRNLELKGLENKIYSIDVDCNPMYFARIRMPNDTLQVINDRKIKWKRMHFERPR
jgi:hypothetical protein